MCKDELCRFVLQIGRVAVFSENAFNQNFDLRAGAFAKRPVDGDAFANLGDLDYGRSSMQQPTGTATADHIYLHR